MSNQLQINPIFYQAEKSDQWPQRPRAVFGNGCLRKASLSEVTDIDAMRDQYGVGIISALALVKAACGDNDQVRLLDEPPFHFEDRSSIGAPKLGIFVHA